MAKVITKGLIGKEDISYGVGTFSRATSTGGTQTLTKIPASTDVETLTNKTLTSPAISSPTITGTPTGAGIQTITLKIGSKAGSYTGTNTSYADIDATNLAYTVTIPTGWKLAIFVSGTAGISTGPSNTGYILYDTFTATNLLPEAQVTPAAAGAANTLGFSLVNVIAGDGNSHTIKLQAKTFTGADAWVLSNTNACYPAMLFILAPSN